MSEQSFDRLLEQVAAETSREGALRSAWEPEASGSGLESMEGPAVSATPISRPAIDLLIAAEVSSRAFYEAKLQHPVWPHGNSGVTIGIGYDVGTVNAAELRRDWADEMQAGDITTLSRACGVLGQPASALAGQMGSVSVSYAHAERVFLQRSVPGFVAKTERALPNTDLLGPDCLGALVSLAYNRGPAFNAAGDRFREMRAIRDHMQAKQFGLIPAEFRSMKRIWANDPNAKGLLLRRDAEASLFEHGLGDNKSEMVVQDNDPHLDPDAPPPPPMADEGLEAIRPWRVAESLMALRKQVNAAAPHRSTASDGTIGNAEHAARTSDHNPWVIDGSTGVVTAMDITHDPANGCDAGVLAEALRSGKDARIKYVIWNRRIASATVHPWEWRPYTGANPHNHHMHLSVQEEKAKYDSTAAWGIKLT